MAGDAIVGDVLEKKVRGRHEHIQGHNVSDGAEGERELGDFPVGENE